MPQHQPSRRRTTDLLREVDGGDLSDCGWIFERFVGFARERAAQYVAVKPLARGYTSDAVQIGLMQAARCIKRQPVSHDWRTSSGFHALLSTIVLRRLIDFTRRQNKIPTREFDRDPVDHECLPDPVDETAIEEIRKLATAAAVQLFAELDEPRQMVAYLAIIEDWKAADIEQWLHNHVQHQSQQGMTLWKVVKLRSIQLWIRDARKAIIDSVISQLKQDYPDLDFPDDVLRDVDSSLIDRSALPSHLSNAARNINDDDDATA